MSQPTPPGEGPSVDQPGPYPPSGPGQRYQPPAQPYQPPAQPYQPPAQPYQPFAPAQPPLSDADARLWSTLSHIGVIITGFVGPLIIWAVFKDRSPLVRENAAAATNFGILMTIATIVGSILMVVVVGLFIMLAAWALAVIFGIIGAIKANNGEVYAYPFNVKWVK